MPSSGSICTWWAQPKAGLASTQCMCVCVHLGAYIPLFLSKIEKEWVHVLFLQSFTHWMDKQSIPIKASCSPGDCRRIYAPSDHIILWKSLEWPIVMRRKRPPSRTTSVGWPRKGGGGSGNRLVPSYSRKFHSDECWWRCWSSGICWEDACSRGLPLLLRVGQGGKLIVWWGLIRWC